MYIRSLRTFVAGAALASVIGIIAAPTPARAEQPTILSIQTGHSVVLDVKALNRVAVGDGHIAGVVPIGTSQVVINGKSPGHTTIFLWSKAGRQSYEITVTEQGFDDVAKLLRAAVNEPGVSIVAFGSNMVVRGTVPDQAAFTRLDDILDRFKNMKFTSGGSNGVILNTVAVAHPLGDAPEELSQIQGATGVRIDLDGKGDVIVSGSVHDRSTAERILSKVRGLAGQYLSADGHVLDRLALDTTSQVDVKVYVLEVDRTAQSQLGLRLQSALAGGVPTTNLATLPNQTWIVSSTPTLVGIENPQPGSWYGRALGIGNFGLATMLAPSLDLVLQEGHSRLLSAPELMTTPGNEASFLVGGQIPIPVSNGLGTVTVTYKDFGVRLVMTPTLLGNGGIETKLNPEVSELDPSDGVTLNGFLIPALKVSRVQTDVITQSGESIILGGLLHRVESKVVTKIPVLADLPILGQLFRSTAYQRSDSDVVFVMTPTIVTR